jgi:hypothetical protein
MAACAASYVGETGRATEDCMKDHRANTKHPNGLYTSKVKQHMHSEDHYFTPRDVTVLDREANWHTRGIRESIQIRALNPTLNADQGRHKLLHCYDNIINDRIAPIVKRIIQAPKDTANMFHLPITQPQPPSQPHTSSDPTSVPSNPPTPNTANTRQYDTGHVHDDHPTPTSTQMQA